MKHTPEQSDAFLAMLRTLTPFKYQDISYGNDACDSVYIDQYKIQIFMPNMANPFAEQMECEDFTYFAVSFFDFDVDVNGTYIDHQFSVVELIHFLNALEWRYEVFDSDDSKKVSLYELLVAKKNNDNVHISGEFVKPLLGLDVHSHISRFGSAFELDIERIS
jgi:hypothetical protein